MSVDKLTERKDKSRSINLSGSRADLAALANVLDTGALRINADIYPDEKDIPGRISLKTGSVLQITRVRKAMKDIANGLREEGSQIDIDFGMIDVRDRPAHEKTEYLGIMDGVTKLRTGRSSSGYNSDTGLDIAGASTVTSIRDIFDVRTYAEDGPGDQGFLSDMDIRWVHAEALVSPEMEVRGKKIGKPKDMVGIKQYPAKFNTKKMKAWAKEQGINRGYIVIAEVDRFFPLSGKVHIKPGKWEEWLHKMPAGRAIMPSYESKPPRTLASVLEVMSVYATGRAFDLENARAVPFDLSIIDKQGATATSKIRTWANVLGKAKMDGGEEVPIYRNYFGFVVVGKGPYKPMGLTRVPEEPFGDIRFPDL